MNLENKSRITKDIVIYEDFISPEVAEKLVKVLDKHAEVGTITWMPISFYESYSSVLPQDDDEHVISEGLPSDIFSQMKQGIIEAVASVHDLDPKVICQIGYHTQNAAFLYLNDNFEGGFLQFPDQDISIKPKVGMLAAFDGGFNNMHEVTVITKGVRYTIGSFWDDREEDAYPQEVRDAWAEEMKQTRAQQEVERAEWQELLKQGWKLDANGNKYRAEEL